VANPAFRFGQAGTVVLAGFLLAFPAFAEEKAKPFAVKRIRDVVYYDGEGMDDKKHKLDLYLPEGTKEFPVLFFVHGGAWRTGDRNYLMDIYGTLAKVYAKQGIGVVVISYRLSPGVKHPEHVKDVARAFAWTYKNIGKYGGKTDQIFVCGHSAGGHLVALLAADEVYLKAHDLSPAAIRGVIPISGVYEIADGFLASVFGDEEGAGKKASPLSYVKKGLPPFLILYADKDYAMCGKTPSEKFCKLLNDKGTRARALEIKESNHFLILFAAGKTGTNVSSAIVDFIRNGGSK
jgi:acetyl esterase/lipase